MFSVVDWRAGGRGRGGKPKRSAKKNEISQPLIGNGLVGGAPRIETIENRREKRRR